MDTKPFAPAYVAVSAATAVTTIVLYVMLYMLGRIEPRIESLYGVPVVVDRQTMLYISASISATLLPVYLYARRTYNWLQKLREQSRDFLLIFSGLVETTESIHDALIIASRMVGRPLSLLLEYMARIYQLTGNLDEAFKRAFQNVPRDVRLLLSSVTVAARGGGRMEEIIAQAANYSNELRRFNVLVESRLAEYTAIVMLGSLTFSFTTAVIIKLLQVLQKAGNVPFLAAIPELELMIGAFFYGMLVLTILSSIVVGKVIKGYTPISTKYIVFLVPVNTLILLYLPRLIPG